MSKQNKGIKMKDLAYHIIAVADEAGKAITPLQIQMIMYQCFKKMGKDQQSRVFLRFYESYQKHPFLVWRYGPHIKSIQDEFGRYGANMIIEDFNQIHELRFLNPDIIDLLNQDVIGLVNKTHTEWFWKLYVSDMEFGRSNIPYPFDYFLGRMDNYENQEKIKPASEQVKEMGIIPERSPKMLDVLKMNQIMNQLAEDSNLDPGKVLAEFFKYVADNGTYRLAEHLRRDIVSDGIMLDNDTTTSVILDVFNNGHDKIAETLWLNMLPHIDRKPNHRVQRFNSNFNDVEYLNRQYAIGIMSEFINYICRIDACGHSDFG